MNGNLMVSKLPARKGIYLSFFEPGKVTALARFLSKEKAEEFIRIVTAGPVEAGGDLMVEEPKK